MRLVRGARRSTDNEQSDDAQDAFGDHLIHRSRAVQVGKTSFCVESSESADVSRLIDNCYIDLPVAFQAELTFRLKRIGVGHALEWESVDGGSRREIVVGDDGILDEIVRTLNRAALDADADHLHLHAGAASSNGRVALVVAPSGGGKTTTVTALGLRDWAYLSDEMVTVSRDNLSVSAFPKPLSIKNSGFDPISNLLGLAETDASDRSQSGWQLAASSLGISTATEGIPKLIVILESAAAGPLPPQAISPGTVLVNLVEQSMDFDRFGPDALGVLASLVSRTSHITIGRLDPRTMAENIEEAMDSISHRNEADASYGFELEQYPFDVEGVRVGGDLVVRSRLSGRIVSLPEQSAELFDRFAHAPGAARSSDQEQLIHQLVAVGLLPEWAREP